MSGRMAKIGIVLFSMLAARAAHTGVIINEIFYNAPNDRDDIQWIELYNNANQPVDLTGWNFNQGKLFAFSSGTILESQGYLVVALAPAPFNEIYGITAIGPFLRPLKRSGERIELIDARGYCVDAAKFNDSFPWPLAANGYSASLERICPDAPGDDPGNWASSPLPENEPAPSGTPGKQNSCFSAAIPLTFSYAVNLPLDPLVGQPIRIQTEIKNADSLRNVNLLYNTISGGVASDETSIPMIRTASTDQLIADIPAQTTDAIVRYRIKAVNELGVQQFYPRENDLRPSFSTYVHSQWERAKIPFGFMIHTDAKSNSQSPKPPRPGEFGGFFGFGPGGQSETPRPPRGSSSFVYVDSNTGATTLFDYINIVERFGDRGYRLFFHKDRTLKDMSSVSLINEGNERFLLAEALSYDLYRRAGVPASQSEFLRLWIDGQLYGYHLLVERPNRSFLKQNKIDTGGNLYKLRWMGESLEQKYEKKTNTQTDHEDLKSLLDLLEKTKGDEQWQIIQNNINVDEMAGYFAVNMILSHWDGFFNNYFVYHDVINTNKWEIYPWDQDKTWGYYDGLPEGEVFFNMPLTYGMEGAQPPASEDQPNREGFGPPPDDGFGPPPSDGFGSPPGGPFGGMFGGFGGGPFWWRDGGEFSKPLLANPQFRQIFLKRVKEIVVSIYTQEIYFPLIDETASKLADDVKLMSKLYGEDPANGSKYLENNVQSLRNHLVKRRQFLLEQEELRSLDNKQSPDAADKTIQGASQ